MSSGDEQDGERAGEQKGPEAASALKEDDVVRNGDGSSAVQMEDTLEEGWPHIEIDRDRGLVVCTIDTQLLSGGFLNLVVHMCLGFCDSEVLRHNMCKMLKCS